MDVGQGLGVFARPRTLCAALEGPDGGRSPTRFASAQTPVLLKNLLGTIAKERWQMLEHRQAAKGPPKSSSAFVGKGNKKWNS